MSGRTFRPVCEGLGVEAAGRSFRPVCEGLGVEAAGPVPAGVRGSTRGRAQGPPTRYLTAQESKEGALAPARGSLEYWAWCKASEGEGRTQDE